MSDGSASDRWREIDSVFREALELDPDDWSSFLDRRCAGDRDLADAVRALLAADRGAGSFLEDSAEALAPDEVARAVQARVGEAAHDRVGETVGSFRIVRQLGRGGMAGVYEAERIDGEFDQRIAIKFLRRGLDTEDFVRRFVVERQILSSLEHPNIARLVDGGTTAEGLPYLALEYVDGVPITRYCDENRCSVEERLRLFGQVARAVQYAHTQLVVHRDIKPSNILVSADGQVKLLDFGIAKLLDPEAGPPDAPLTRTGVMPLTPEYASPEQARGETITTASDVYQLGILLYRLLTGERPYEVSGTGTTIETAIVNTRPKAPSMAAIRLDAADASRFASSPARLNRRLRGDLDTIVLKALRKEPERRYPTALEMADDVERHLAARPIAARRESRLYRTGKFFVRHVWVAPVSVAALLLSGAYVATLIRHGQELEEERNVARDVQQAFVSFFTAPDSADSGLGEGRRDLTILEAIREGTDRVRGDLADRPAARAELFGAMAEVLQDLDEPDEAHELAVEALELERALYGEESAQVHERLLLVGALTEDVDSARAVLERQLALSHQLYGPDAAESATSLDALAAVDLREGKLEDAVARLEAAVEIYRAEAAADPRRLASALGQLAGNLEPLDRADDAIAAAREAYDVLLREYGPDHSETARQGARLARSLTASGAYDEARPLYEASVATLADELGPTHTSTIGIRNNYAILLRLIGDLDGAEVVYRELLAAQRERYGDIDAEIGVSLQNLATTVKDLGRYDEAEELSRSAREMFVATRGPEHFQTAFPLLTIAEIQLLDGRFTEAEATAREAYRELGEALPAGHFATAVAQCRIGEALAGRGLRADARSFLIEGTDALQGSDRPEVDAYHEACRAALEAL